ncbi:MAG TPA: carbamoyltransferase HypF [Opitutaceae bacterium]|nr:carbamoyltransferase HypF [Opitutaceae bacterium]
MRSSPREITDRLLRVRGTVQGVGFRPFVLRVATELGLRGWVRNDTEGVLVRAIGEPRQLERLATRLANHAPPAARVLGVETIAPPATLPAANGGFEILDSSGPTSEISTTPPPDLALCTDCRRELAVPRDRRAGYVFINCTQCGPRYSIIESLPYDRPRTTMRCFQMCPACRREYAEPRDRRFHAEPNACPVCGPQLVLTAADGRELARGDAALAQTQIALRDGKIVAVKGIGGFHLMCDATNDGAVVALRRRKHREEKPFAVMFADLDRARAATRVSIAAAALLNSPAAPIVLVPRRENSSLVSAVAPANPWIGALLAATPLHVRLLEPLEFPVVATSANLSEEPLCIDDAEAASRLSGIADVFLGHDRAIARPVDDSVVRFTSSGAPIVLRRARGYAPSPLLLPASLAQPLVCVGGHMKNTVAVASGDRVVLSPHIGDLGGAATQEVFARTIDTLGALFGARPAGVVCDKHPDYASTRFAESTGLPRIAVQHHLAHVLAVLLEHRREADDVLGIAWDGTGYGEDGTIWGGEFILLRNGRATRFARLRPFRLPGGDAAVRDPRRVALALAAEIGDDAPERVTPQLGFAPSEAANLRTMIACGLNAPLCTSAGRLFDGVGALLGLGHRNAFEGQTPLAVEIAATRAARSERALPFDIHPAEHGAVWEIDWQPAVEEILARPVLDPAELAAAFHVGLARAMSHIARLADVRSVALGGGCFQNALLHELATTHLAATGCDVLVPRELPPNDGAISAGQALGALWNLTTVELPGTVTAFPTPLPEFLNPRSPCVSLFPEE